MQTFVQFQPVEPLRSIVKKILVLEYKSSGGIVQPSSFYADGYPGFFFQQTQNNSLIYNRSRKLPPLFLYGQTVAPVELLPSGSYRMIIFLLYPQMLKSLFRVQPKELRDTCLDITLLPFATTTKLLDLLHAEENCENQVGLMNQYLIDLMRKQQVDEENMIRYAVSHIANNRNNVSLRQLRGYLNVTERTFERKFEQYVGVPPKLFLRICQFQASLQQISQKDFGKLSDVAYDNGYADQAYFIRVFKEFTGLTPLEYQRLTSSPNAIAEPF